ncbi:MAG: SdpI family protein [Peptoniphilaceae bacterium]|nr:SdpI family protein [Peptoniphilaceae bacterium]MDY3737519.1 SdpI family protein [Peptoniphilaceae bacterium]
MDIGFHIMEVCHNKETWNYGNAFAGNLSIFLGIIFFIIIFPLSLIFKFQRTFYIFFLLFLALCYVLLMFLIVKYKIKKKFNLKKRN